jgi:hypothetical protein
MFYNSLSMKYGKSGVSRFKRTGSKVWDIPGRKSANKGLLLDLRIAILPMQWQSVV